MIPGQPEREEEMLTGMSGWMGICNHKLPDDFRAGSSSLPIDLVLFARLLKNR